MDDNKVDPGIDHLSQTFTVSHRSLRLVASLFWYGGCIALCYKASRLLIEARSLNSAENWLWVAVACAIIVGVLKGELIFNRSCQKNLRRINGLNRPQIWQFFKPKFFLFMIVMILTGAILSRLAHNNYPFLIGVAFIDLSIATALLLSSRHFWKQTS